MAKTILPTAAAAARRKATAEDAGLCSATGGRAGTRRTPHKKPAFDPQSLVADIDHRDDALLANIARKNALYDQCEAARRRGRTAFDRALNAVYRESLELSARIDATPAVTREGLYQKASLALRDSNGDPDLPCGGFQGIGAGALSALHDVIASGRL